MAGTKAISGVSIAVQGFSRTMDPPMEQTALVSFQTSPDTPAAWLRPCFIPSRNSRAERAPETDVYVNPSDASVCASLPPMGMRPLRSANSAAHAVRHFEDLSVARLDSREFRGEVLEIGLASGSGQARKQVIDAEQQPLFVQERDQSRQIVATQLQIGVIALLDPVNPHVQMRAMLGNATHFFAEEEIGMMAQGFHRVDGIVIGHRNQVHSAALQRFVDFQRIAIAFAANPLHDRHGTHAGVTGVNMQVAFHAPLLSRECYKRAASGKTFVT